MSKKKPATTLIAEAAQELQNESLINALPAAVWAKDADGRFLLTNALFARFFELPEDVDFVGRLQDEFFSAEDVARFLEKDRQIIASNQSSQFYEPVHVQSGIKHLLTLKFPLHNTNGQAVAACGMCVDISAAVRLRENLQHSNERFAAREAQLLALSQNPAIDSGDLPEAMRLIATAAREGLGVAHIGIWLWDDARETLICRHFLDNDGTAPPDHPKHIRRADYPVYFAALEENRLLVADDAQRDPLTITLVDSGLRPPGIRSMLDASIRVDGEIAGLFCCSHRGALRTWTEQEKSFAAALACTIGRALVAQQRDVADRALRVLNQHLETRAAAETREAEAVREQLRNITDQMPGAVFQTHWLGPGQFQFLYISDGIQRMTGLPTELYLNAPLRVLEAVHPEDLPGLIHTIDAHGLHPDRNLEYSFRVHHASSGALVWIQAQACGRIEPDGRVLFNGAFTDITSRKRLELSLAEVTMQAQAASKAKSEFLANMSHEIRTPMNAVIGLSELLLHTELNAQQQSYLDKLQGASRTLLSLLNDILDLSKIEAGKLEVEQAPFDLDVALNELLALAQPLADSKGLRLQLQCDARLPKLLVGDALRLGQVLRNLISNAIKFTDSGEVSIQVSALPGKGAVVPLRFVVRDTGIGIAPARVARMFQPFEQADASTSRRYGGSGLGLTICRQLVTLMGGEMGVESEPDKGSLFWVVAPFGQASHAMPPTAAVNAPIKLAGLRVLVAEDNDINLEIITELLQRQGIEVRTSCDGAEAIAGCADGWPELVLMDMQMPNVDGLTATARLRSDARFAALPIIALSANAMSEDRARCLAAGMNDHLPKPIDVEDLYAMLRRWRPLLK